MLFQDAILKFGFDCKARKASPKSIINDQKQLKYLQRYMEKKFQIKNVEEERNTCSKGCEGYFPGYSERKIE